MPTSLNNFRYYYVADIFSIEKRSKVMGLVKGKNTKPEILLRKNLHALGFRFRVHDKKLPGKPDIKLPKYKTVIFINGCFWHGHENCKHYTIPKANREFWVDKLKINMNRDNINYEKLRNLGWNILVIWTCKLKKNDLENTVNKIVVNLMSLNID